MLRPRATSMVMVEAFIVTFKSWLYETKLKDSLSVGRLWLQSFEVFVDGVGVRRDYSWGKNSDFIDNVSKASYNDSTASWICELRLKSSYAS